MDQELILVVLQIVLEGEMICLNQYILVEFYQIDKNKTKSRDEVRDQENRVILSREVWLTVPKAFLISKRTLQVEQEESKEAWVDPGWSQAEIKASVVDQGTKLNWLSGKIFG